MVQRFLCQFLMQKAIQKSKTYQAIPYFAISHRWTLIKDSQNNAESRIDKIIPTAETSRCQKDSFPS